VSVPTKTDNTVDNVEQVSIPTPARGTYLVRVTHKENLVNSSNQVNFQRLSLLVSGNEPQP